VSDGTDPAARVDPTELAELQRSLAALAAQLNDVAARVDEVARRQASGPVVPGYDGYDDVPGPGDVPAAEPGPGIGRSPAPAPPGAEPPSSPVTAGPIPVAPQPVPPGPVLAPPAVPWPVPQGAVPKSAIGAPGSAAAGPPAAGRPAAPADPHWRHPAGDRAAADVAAPGAPPPSPSWAGATVRPHPGEMPTAAPPGAPTAASIPVPKAGASWADTAGLKVLGWVGGGVTVLGIVLLLVIAAQQGILGPLARVIIGLVLGAVLVGGAALLHRRPAHGTLAVTIGCTGLAVEYLAVVGAVRLADLFPPLVGHGASALIVVVAVSMAVAWREPWLAGASFAVSGLLAPVVGGGFSASVLGFEAVMVAGGAACLLLGLGIFAWAGAGIAAVFAFLMAMALDVFTPVGLVLTIVVVAIAWATFIGRWAMGRVPIDPGPFPVRPRSHDPEQVARDYADFHEHNRRRDEARLHSAVATVSLSIGAGLLAVALVVVEPAGVQNLTAGMISAVLTVLFAIVAWASGRHAPLAHTSTRVVAWCGTIALAGVSLLRLLGGDARSVSWVVLATVILVIVAVERLTWLIAPALAAAGVALLAAGPALHPSDLLGWPAPGLVDGGGLLMRGWTVVLPGGICVIAMCFAAWWAVARVTAARVTAVRVAAAHDGTDRVGADRADVPYRGPTAVPAGTVTPEQHRTTVMGWTLVGCSAVACYGLLAVTMVLAYAVSPTHAGHQAGQIVVTIFVTLVALALLWQGFRRLIVRLGGLGLAAVAVAKLLLLDTSTLEALPRAITVIGVGVLLLLGAVAYLAALSRVGGAGLRSVGGPRPAPDEQG